MSIKTPAIVPFNTVDANEYFYIKYIGDPSSTANNRFRCWRFVATNLDINKTTTTTGSAIYNLGETDFKDFDTYFYDWFVNKSMTNSIGVWSPYTHEYCFGFPKNYIHNDQIIFENGYHYSIEIDFGVNTPTEVITIPHPFACYANFEVALESYQYNDGIQKEISQDDISIPYELTVTKSFCQLNFSYTQEEGEPIKYHQFSLFDDNGNLLGKSSKIYGIPNGGIVYTVENYNNLQHYVLKLYCVTQTNRDSITTVNIYTNYEQDNIYADITFSLNSETATNNISISVTQLNGSGDGYSFSNDEYVVIPDNGYVNFVDTYQTISNNFLCRIWCRNLAVNLPILTIKTTNGDGYIEVFFTGQNFVAYKHSCNIVTTYISNDLIEDIKTDQDIYFAMGYYNGRIEMYTIII
jgi:hypothetical protein